MQPGPCPGPVHLASMTGPRPPEPTDSMTHLRIVIVSGIILLSGFVVPGATAQTAGTWTSHVLSTGTTTSTLTADNQGEVVAFIYKSGNDYHFWRIDTAGGTPAEINADITGADNPSADTTLKAGETTGEWVVCMRLTVVTCWFTVNNGVTWTKQTISGSAADFVADIRLRTGGVFEWVYNSSSCHALYQRFTAYGATAGPVRDVSDNRGDPTTGPSASMCGIQATIDDTPGPLNTITIYFAENSVGGEYKVTSEDGGTFWTVPYTAEGGSTKNPIANSQFCGSTPMAYMASKGGGLFASILATKNYFCMNTKAVSSATPTNTLTGPQNTAGKGLGDCNTAHQCIMGFSDLTADKNYIYYQEGTAAPSLVYQNSADTQTYQALLTPSLGYFFFVNNAVGGQMQYATASVFTIQGTQVAVTNLVGYSMDSLGLNIVARTENGQNVRTYGVSNLAQVATAATPNCDDAGTYYDGVNSAAYTIDNVAQVYITYADCEATTGDTNAFRIRQADLSTPSFPCSQATPNITNNADIDVPNKLGQVGTISDITPGYRRADGTSRCGTSGSNTFATVGWSFSEHGNGKIGAFAATYNSAGDDFDDKKDATLDATAFPEIDSFCAWQDPVSGKDYLGGVTVQGATGVYELITHVEETGAGAGLAVPTLTMSQKFFNSGAPYGNAQAIACAQQDAIIETGTTVTRLNDVMNTTRTVAYTKTVTSPAPVRGLAFTASGKFAAYVDGSTIHIINATGVETGTQQVPSGTWRGMEFDASGQHLAVFTSTFITVYGTSTLTCATTNTCANDSVDNGGISQGGDGAVSNTDSGTCSGALFCTDSTNVPAGFTTGSFGNFLGGILIAGIAGGAYATTKSGTLAAIMAIVGLVVAIALGLVGVWVAVVLAIVGLAILFLKARSGA